jgi:sugar lactone lactonase YvrE
VEEIVRDLAFPEAPRWHDGRLVFSDFHTHRVQAVAEDGSLETICEVPGQPSGLGWDRDGRLLVVSMLDQRVLRVQDGTPVEHADLSALAGGPCNDMAVDASGRAWVSEFGYRGREAEPRPGALLRVDPDGAATVAADGLWFGNGIAVMADGTLLVAELLGLRITAFDVGPDGALSGRRAWAAFAPAHAPDFASALSSGAIVPDGICLDPGGALWVADVAGGAAKLVAEGGEVLEVVPAGADLTVYAPCLGGPDGRTLFLCAGPHLGTFDPDVERRGCILAARV